jgi:prophage maintenance system killer protein
LCLVEFVERNEYEWTPPPADGLQGDETVQIIEAAAAGQLDEQHLARWIADRIAPEE